MNFLRGWPFESMDFPENTLCGDGDSGGGSPG